MIHILHIIISFLESAVSSFFLQKKKTAKKIDSTLCCFAGSARLRTNLLIKRLNRLYLNFVVWFELKN
jgi:hypothetical protein